MEDHPESIDTAVCLNWRRLLKSEVSSNSDKGKKKTEKKDG